jgi:hypothetical protein
MSKLERPLHFAAVTDHAEWLGEMRLCSDPERSGYDSDICWGYREARDSGLALLAAKARAHERFEFCGEGARLCADASREAWRDTVSAAEEAYDRSPACSFTAFAAWEWTGTLGRGSNLHRNVIFGSGRVPHQPTGYVEAPSAESLWKALRSECHDPPGACTFLTIPHNSNLSGGLMFGPADQTDTSREARSMSRAEAQERANLEPLIEIMQHKGDSECLLDGDTRDEACAFEKVPYDSFEGASLGPPSWSRLVPTRAGTVREALKRGLIEEARLGINPFAYGILASTDTHTAMPGSVDERGYTGHTSTNKGEMKGSLPDVVQYNPGGLAGVFAEENTRESLFAALRRKEVFGTSGPRIVIRLFGGPSYPDDLCSRDDFVERGYAGGVPMGGSLEAPAPGSGPTFALLASSDPGSASSPGNGLDRIQIVKGWLEHGRAHERVVDVAGGEQPGKVDPTSCSVTSEPAHSLCAVWRDPDFDPSEHAFYYARVLEDPSCRWSQRVCNARGVDCNAQETLPADLAPCCHEIHRPIIQERAWTSPIWYAPPPTGDTDG